jgi:hypothetical protein
MPMTRRPASHSRLTVVVMLAVAALLVCAGSALAASPWPSDSASPSPGQTPAPGDAASPPALAVDASPSPDPSPSASPSPVPTVVTCKPAQASVVFGGKVAVRGTVTPAAAGQPVVIVLDGIDKVTVTTDAAGAYSATLAPHSTAVVAARAADGTLSAPAKITVNPRVALSHGVVIPFLSLRYTVKVAPAAYDGVVVIKVSHRGHAVATVKARCRKGVAAFSLPLPGIEWFAFAIELPAAQDLGARSLTRNVKAEWATLRAGSTGPRVKGLLGALRRLKIRVPGVGTTFTTACNDSVVAFQKAYGLSRDYVMDHADWRKLDGATPRVPRHRGSGTHIEVDKTRQILMVVRDGTLAGMIAVSTGATGNTPEGSFSIHAKSPVTTPLFGSGYLTWVMGFVGNFAIHGYPDVPPYAASHGCVREPMWVAKWTYDQSFVGESLYVYH